MNGQLRLASIVGAALLAGACTTSFEQRHHASLPVEQRLPVELSTDAALLNVELDQRGRLTARSQADVAGFLGAYRAEGGGRLQIQTSGARVTAPAEAEIAEIAAIHGVPSSSIGRASLAGRDGAPALRLAYTRYVARVPACENPDWSQNLALTWDNTPYPPFGCATQQNIAAMASDPRDLVRARPMDPADSTRRTRVLDSYRKGQDTASQGADPSEGSVSTVAK